MQQSSSVNSEALKHAYIVAILKALVIFTLPFVLITVYFNFIDQYRPIPLFTLLSIFTLYMLCYNSASKKTQGTGLGLLICKQILRLMDGDIRVQSIPNVGSTFQFSVLLVESTPPPELSSTQDINVSGLSVLIVEDNFINQMVLQEILASLDISSEIAENGEEAIQTLNEAKDSAFALILMDCQMPVMDGFQATQAIREGRAGERWQQIPIIALTANALAGDREACLDAGMNEYLTKPIDKDALQTLLQQFSVQA